MKLFLQKLDFILESGMVGLDGGAALLSNELSGHSIKLLFKIPQKLKAQLFSTNGRLFLAACVITVLTSLHYFWELQHWTTVGFPLDDSWIHVQYARTIFEGHPWEYSPGRPSTGSTSPLWSLILSTIFIFTTDPEGIIVGVYLLSFLGYVGCTFLTGLLVLRHTNRALYALLGMIGFVITPHTTWLMLSGMEFPLFMLVLLLSIFYLERGKGTDRIILGVLFGLAYLSRPEGILLVGSGVLFWIAFRVRRGLLSKILKDLLTIILIAFLIAIPWILHCLNVTGLPLPDTFYAKVHPVTDSEIAAWNTWWTFWLLTMPMLSIGAIFGVLLFKTRRPFLWVYPLELLLLYRFYMPYQSLINNARYLVPIFVMFMLCAIISSTMVFDKLQEVDFSIPNVGKANLASVLVVVGVLLLPILPQYYNQARLYGNAVKNINEMQVEIAYWIRENTPPDAIIATHDVGAIRFFSQRTVIDLAGLVSPEILHGNMTRYETLRYLRSINCSYFAFFDELFWLFSRYLRTGYYVLYRIHLDDNVISGRDTMSVFFVNWSETAIS